MPKTEAARSNGKLLLIAYIGFISLGLPDTLIGVAWPSIRERFGLAQGSLGWLLIASGAGYFFSSFFTGSLLRLLGVGMLLASSTALVAMSGFGYALASLWLMFSVFSLLQGFGSGAIDGALNHFVAHQFSARHMNWLHACYCIGATIGPLVMTRSVTTTSSWRAGYGTIAAIMAVLTFLFLGTRKRWNLAASENEDKHAPSSFTYALRQRIVWLQMLLFFVYTGLEVTVSQWAFTVLTELRGIPAGTAGLGVSLFWGALGAGRILFGIVVSRMEIDRLLRGCMLLAVIAVTLYCLGLNPWFNFVALALIGLALAPVYPCLMTRTPERLGPQLSAHAIGFQVSSAMIGAAVLPAIAGGIGQQFGLFALTVCAVAFSLLMFALHEMLVRYKR